MAKQIIHSRASDFNRVITEFAGIMKIFAKPDPKKEILKFVSEYLKSMDSKDSLMDDFVPDIFSDAIFTQAVHLKRSRKRY